MESSDFLVIDLCGRLSFSKKMIQTFMLMVILIILSVSLRGVVVFCSIILVRNTLSEISSTLLSIFLLTPVPEKY